MTTAIRERTRERTREPARKPPAPVAPTAGAVHPWGAKGQATRSFTGLLARFPHVWQDDLEFMLRHLNPQPGERILEIGAGGGYFSTVIAEAIGPGGHLTVVDPAPGQLRNLRALALANVEPVELSADRVELPAASIDAIWSRGAFHHVLDKTAAFKTFRRAIKDTGRLAIFDTFAGSNASRYFDDHVAKASRVGHEAAHLSREFAESLCHITGWERPHFIDVSMRWHFESRAAIGAFLKLLHETTDDYTEVDSLEAASHHLGIEPVDGGAWQLNWPMTLMTAWPR